MSAGHPELVAAIASEVIASGPIPFARFMELALYHPQLGYYMRSSEPVAERIGWKGDFYTSSDVHPILGHALAKQAEQMDRLLGQPTSFTLVEMGPGKGLLAGHILSTCQRDYPSLFHRLHYTLIERSPAMREAQRIHLAPWLQRPDLITWVDDLASIPLYSLTGLCLSNELVDSFPVHRIQLTAHGLDLANSMTLSRELAAAKEQIHKHEKQAIQIAADSKRFQDALKVAQDKLKELEADERAAQSEIAELRAELAESWALSGGRMGESQPAPSEPVVLIEQTELTDVQARAQRIEEDLRFERMHVQQLERRLNSWTGLASAALRKITRLGGKSSSRRAAAPRRLNSTTAASRS